VRPTRPLLPLNGQLSIAGETFFSHQVCLDPDDRILFIQHPQLGELKITERDDLIVKYLHQEVFACIRAMQHNHGWEAVTIKQLFDLITKIRSQED
jgi:hypothetical protein